MNAAGSALVWCAVQVALVGVATVSVYWLVVRLHQTAGGFAATTGLAVVFCLSAAAASPWPRWSFLDKQPVENDDRSPRERRSNTPLLNVLAEAFGSGESPVAQSATAPPTGRPLIVGAAPEEMDSPRLPIECVVVEVARPEPPDMVRSVFVHVPGAFWVGPKPPRDGWRWTASAAVMFAAGLALGGIRFLFSLAAAQTLQSRSLPVRDARLIALFASLQSQLGSTRRIAVREIPWLSTPATVGWRRPVILLPSAWRRWSDEERRAVLAHEIAHVERGDYLLWLAAQMALVLHFYHPVVYWLTARIRLEQEFAADAIAAGVAGGRRAYLATLARLTLQAASSNPVLPTLSFVSSHSMLLQRIERLRQSETAPPALGRWSSKFVALAAILLAGLLSAGLRGSGEAPRERKMSRQPGQAAVLQDSLGPSRVGGGAQAIRFL